MTLTRDDYKKILNLIETGEHNSLEYNKEGETLMLEYSLIEEGYREDDYWTGTGAFVCTGEDFRIISVSSFNDEDETENDFSEKILYDMFDGKAA